MARVERLLVPGCTELPDCRCGKEMQLIRVKAEPASVHVRVYRCTACHHEMRLTVWADLTQLELEQPSPQDTLKRTGYDLLVSA